MKSVVPVVMAGILGIYGMIVAVIIVQKSTHFINLVPTEGYKANQAYAHLASGLCCGFSSLVKIYSYLGCWTRYWYSGRRRSEGQRSAGQNLRGNDSDFDFRRGSCLVWLDRFFDLNFSRLTPKKQE